MANKRLSLENIQQMKSMVQKGIAPEDIAKHFNIAISSVHNYKNRFKQEGVKFPNVRGKRPTGSVDVQNKSASIVNHIEQNVTSSTEMNFIVNGIPVKITGEAKHVNISKTSITIDFS